MTASANGSILATRGLDKNFGSLIVARSIALSLPLGARYALIGPNGAGKTTLINLITGMVRPDGGQILLDGEDITGLDPAMRVKRGLVRTFQINTLFPEPERARGGHTRGLRAARGGRHLVAQPSDL